jgi:hypothetical protein
MPIVQGGPPQWIWERTEDFLKTDLVPVTSPEGHTVYELRVDCGMEIIRLQFFTCEDVQALADCIAELSNQPVR